MITSLSEGAENLLKYFQCVLHALQYYGNTYSSVSIETKLPTVISNLGLLLYTFG